MAELAHEYKQPVYLHLAETKKEVEECKMRYGMSPVQFLDSIGLFAVSYTHLDVYKRQD